MLISLFVISSVAQVSFCPEGAEWRYSFASYYPYRIANEKIVYTGYSIESNDTIKKLSHLRFYYSNNDSYYPITTAIKQKGDTVFMKNFYTSNRWQVLYNFSADQGDWWSNSFVDPNGTVNYHTFVDSVSQVTINNQNLKVLFVTMDNDINGFGINPYSAKIIERIGCTSFLFNYLPSPNHSHDGWVKDFLCYKDSWFGNYQPTAFPCDYESLTSVPDSYAKKEFKLFPNPAQNELNIKVNEEPSQSYTIGVVDIYGKTLEKFHLKGGESKKLGTQELPAGVYFLEVILEDHAIVREKFFVEK